MNISRLLSSLCLCGLLLCVASSLSAQQNDFFSYLDERDVTLSQEGRQRLDSLKARTTSISVRLIQFQNLASLNSQQPLRIPLPDAATLTATRTRFRQLEASKLFWSGVLQDGKNPIFFAVVDGSVTGMIHLDQAVFAVEPLEAGYHVLIRVGSVKVWPGRSVGSTLPKSTSPERGCASDQTQS